MSKMSMIHAELMEQCARLGFQDLGEAEQAGYGVDWQNARLIKVEFTEVEQVTNLITTILKGD